MNVIQDGMIEKRKKLEGCEDKILIDENSKASEVRDKIEKYEQENWEYQIAITFFPPYSREQKMEIVNIIDSLNVNEKVGKIWVVLRNSKWISDQLIE